MGLFGKSKFQKAFTPYEMPQEEKPANFWQGGEKFGLKDGLAGVLAVLGDAFTQRGGGSSQFVQTLGTGRLSAIDAARKAQQQAAEIAAARQRAQAAGLSGPLADLMAHGDAKFSDIYSKPPEAPADARLAQWYQNASPEERAAFDQVRPIITNGYGSAVVPRGSLPGAQSAPPGLTPMTPEEIQRLGLPQGGPSQPATGGFPHFRR